MSDVNQAQQRIMQRLSATRQSVVALDVIQQELHMDPKETAAALRGLLQDGRVALRRGGKGEEGRMYLSLAGDLSEHAELVLSAICASGTSGIDQAQLLSKVRIPKSEVLKILSALIEDRHIKERRSFSNRTKRIYLLYNLEPSAHVTGGSFYCGEELDVAYIDELRRRLVAYVAEQRVVTITQIKAFLDDQHVAGAQVSASGASPAEPPHDAASETFYDLSSPISFVNEHAPLQSQLSFPSEGSQTNGGGSVGTAPPRASASSPSVNAPPLSALLSQHVGDGVARPAPQLPPRTLSDRDTQILTHSLILDGILEEVAPGAATELTASPLPRHASSSSASLSGALRNTVGDPFDLYDDDLGGHDGRRDSAQAMSTGAGASGHASSLSLTSDSASRRYYQLAPAGANVVRHFSAMRKRGRDDFWRQRSTSSTDAGNVTLLRLGQRTADLEAERRDQAQRTRTQSRHARLLGLLREEGLFIPSSLSEQTVASSSGGGYMPAVGFPCLGCPQLAQCSGLSTSLLNVHRCAYLKAWLGD